MQFYFIRHAESENNELYARTGAAVGRLADPELTALGRRQARYLAHFLQQRDPDIAAGPRDSQNRRGFPFSHLYSSLMRRSLATATLVAEALAIPLRAWPEIHEWGGIFLADPETGEMQGLPGENRAFFTNAYPHLELPDTLGEEGWWNRPYEAFARRLERAELFARQLSERHGRSDDRVAVISHGGFYNGVMTAVLRLGDINNQPRPPLQFLLNNTGITRIDFDEDAARLIYANRVDFLPRDLIT
jgi:2,3-bisphosphoglycerate-dependent phosphoglycerate mutase